MKLTKSIDRDCKCLESYFHKRFNLMQETLAEEKAAPVETEDADADADESQASYHGFSHLIKPDMIINIYSLTDFWMKVVCDYQGRKRKLSLTHNDIRGDNELHSYHKYLTAYAGIDLKAVQDSYGYLDALRKVRNRFMHHGGHIPTGKENEYSSLPGVSVSISLITIEDDFIWCTLDHARKYLRAVAMA